MEKIVTKLDIETGDSSGDEFGYPEISATELLREAHVEDNLVGSNDVRIKEQA